MSFIEIVAVVLIGWFFLALIAGIASRRFSCVGPARRIRGRAMTSAERRLVARPHQGEQQPSLCAEFASCGPLIGWFFLALIAGIAIGKYIFWHVKPAF